MTENVRAAGWRKASYSNSSGSCVEVGNAATAILVRDTTCRDGLTLTIPAPAWRALLAEVRASWSTSALRALFSQSRAIRRAGGHEAGVSNGSGPSGDYLAAALLVIAPFALAYTGPDRGLPVFYVAAGAAVLAVSLITNCQYRPKRMAAPARQPQSA